jgi:predicted site-specific integrase-resolvase
MPQPRGYTLKQVAEKVGVNAATIVRWINVRKVKITKRLDAQGHYVFAEADLRKLKEHAEGIRIVG